VHKEGRTQGETLFVGQEDVGTTMFLHSTIQARGDQSDSCHGGMTISGKTGKKEEYREKGRKRKDGDVGDGKGQGTSKPASIWASEADRMFEASAGEGIREEKR